MFHLRDTVVLVSTKRPESSEIETGGHSDPVHEIENNIAVVRIIVEQTPELHPPDYEFLATKIQKMCHKWYLRRKVRLNILLCIL